MTMETNSPEETFALGYELGKNAKKGQVYGLVGELGVGKTIFTQGFAKGLGVEEVVSSPTFTIICEYHDGRLPFYHFDVYRIGDIEELNEIGFDEYVYGEGVTLIEWANLIFDGMPLKYTMIRIEKELKRGFDYRKITFEEIGDS